MRQLKATLRLLLLFALLTSCKSPFDELLKSNDVDTVFKGALNYYERGKFLKAADLFDKLLLSVKGTDLDDSVQFYLGLSNYNYGDYSIAEANFEQFITLFPKNQFTEEAHYLRLECLYRSTHGWELDQIPSHKTLSAIELFNHQYPNSKYRDRIIYMIDDLVERADKKSFEAAKLYYTIEDYRAATHALKNVLKENADNQYREEILYYIVTANYKYATNSVKERQRERFMAVVDEYYNFISEYPDSPHRKELEKIYTTAQQYIKKRE